MSSYIYEVVKTEPDVPVRCFRYWDPIGYPVAAHWHNSLEIIRIDEGRMRVMLGEKHLVLCGGEYLIINSRDIHATFSEKDTMVEVLQIPYVFLKRYLPQIDTVRFVREPEDVSISQQVGGLLHRMGVVNTQRGETFLVEFHAMLFELLYLLSVHYAEPVKEAQELSDDANRRRLTQVMDYVNLHYRDKVTLSEVSANVSLNKEYFCRFFKKSMGMSFMDYVNEVRFTHVCEDLFHTDENIMTLLEEHGFHNYKLFMRMFHERYHDTPGRKRRENRLSEGIRYDSGEWVEKLQRFEKLEKEVERKKRNVRAKDEKR